MRIAASAATFFAAVVVAATVAWSQERKILVLRQDWYETDPKEAEALRNKVWKAERKLLDAQQRAQDSLVGMPVVVDGVMWGKYPVEKGGGVPSVSFRMGEISLIFTPKTDMTGWEEGKLVRVYGVIRRNGPKPSNTEVEPEETAPRNLLSCTYAQPLYGLEIERLEFIDKATIPDLHPWAPKPTPPNGHR